MRCFIAFDLSKEVKDYLDKVQKEIGDNEAKINWVKVENQHLTLKFLRDVKKEDINKIKERLKQIEFKRFEAKISKFEVFPDYKYIRLLWIDLEPVKEILELKSKVERVLLDHFPKDDRKFLPHITLGRVKFVKDRNLFIKKLKKVELEEKEFLVDNFKMYKSELTKEGPIYEVLETIQSS